MKLKHFLLTGVLAAVVAVMLLTALVPQTAEAKGPAANYSCYYCGTTTVWGGPYTRAAALSICRGDFYSTANVYCANKGGHVLCSQSSCPQ